MFVSSPEISESAVTTLKYSRPKIDGCVTVAGDLKVDFGDSYADFGLSDKEAARLQRAMGLGTRYVVSGEATTADLCLEASQLLIDGIVFVTQTPDFASPASSVWLQSQLGLRIGSMCFDMRHGCSGFVYGLSVAYALVESGLDAILLCVGDVASKIVDAKSHVVAPLMGDAGSAVLISRSTNQKSTFQLYSDGSGYDALIVPNSGIRRESRYDGMSPLLQMNGAAVFDFTLKRVPATIFQMLETCQVAPEEIDYFLLHQPNKYILQNIKKRLGIADEKIPVETQSRYGNQNSASIPGTLNGFLSDAYSNRKLSSLFCGFGVGLSWGSCMVETDHIYSPNTLHFGGN
jgi:3-oxoacyl-[acyl-carrier-protein] synthase-3